MRFVKPDDVEHEPVDAVPRERLCRDLDADRAHLDLAHPREQGVQLARLGGRERARDRLVADAALGGGGEPGDDAELAEDAVEEVDDARLAVRAGDREERGGVLGGAVDPRCDLAECRTRVGRSTRIGRPASAARSAPVGVGQHGDRAGVARRGRVVGAVGIAARARRRRGRRAARRARRAPTPVTSSPPIAPRTSRPNASARPCSDRGLGCCGRRAVGGDPVTNPTFSPGGWQLGRRGAGWNGPILLQHLAHHLLEDGSGCGGRVHLNGIHDADRNDELRGRRPARSPRPRRGSRSR